jgi:hypothetical protein
MFHIASPDSRSQGDCRFPREQRPRHPRQIGNDAAPAVPRVGRRWHKRGLAQAQLLDTLVLLKASDEDRIASLRPFAFTGDGDRAVSPAKENLAAWAEATRFLDIRVGKLALCTPVGEKSVVGRIATGAGAGLWFGARAD